MNKEEIMNKIQLYEFCENMEELYDDYYVPLQQENKQLKERIDKALKEIDDLQQAIFGLEEIMWIYGALENVTNKLKGDSNE